MADFPNQVGEIFCVSRLFNWWCHQCEREEWLYAGDKLIVTAFTEEWPSKYIRYANFSYFGQHTYLVEISNIKQFHWANLGDWI